ncbi:Methyl-CpG DNA binding [Trema orientale]|uniref:Methyl-CpG DNA binding n=1 Tax=Trema orientale TaxID=63057 RepID=A0A2P5AQ25_TREOI|nr:Methyl-CpG DNA binding [Trema orientale]
MKLKSRAQMPVVRPPCRREAAAESGDRKNQLQVGSTSSATFQLPHDWLVEEKPRLNSPSRAPHHVDKYYYEPGTGKMFRSLRAVQRYLTYGETDASPAKVTKKSGVSKGSVALKELGDECKQIIPFTSNVTLPDGWIIETKQRRAGVSAGVIDKYYIEPGTGKQFRSLRAVERHLQETKKDKTPLKVLERRLQETNEDTMPHEMQLTPLTTKSKSTLDFVLPHGWIIKKKRRQYRGYGKSFDKFYIEPETGNEFRSLRAVERHLKDGKEYTMTLMAFKHSHEPTNVSSKSDTENEYVPDEIHSTEVVDEHPTKSKENTTTSKEVMPGNDSENLDHSDSPNKSASGEKVEPSINDFAYPPSSVNWVLAGPGGDMWNPFVDKFMVPETTKRKWSETFISSLHDENFP